MHAGTDAFLDAIIRPDPDLAQLIVSRTAESRRGSIFVISVPFFLSSQATVSAVLRVLAQAYQRAASPIPGTKQLPPGPPLISLRVALPRDEGTAGWMGAAVVGNGEDDA